MLTKIELNIKLDRIRYLLDASNLDAILLRRTNNFSWATCGAEAHINTADSKGNASLLITHANRFVATNNIEATRLMHEDELAEQGWELQVSPWYEGEDQIVGLSRGMKLGADTDFPFELVLSDEIVLLRSQPAPEEGNRYRNQGNYVLKEYVRLSNL